MALSTSLIRDLRAVHAASVDVDVPLAPLTTIRTGGSAGALVTVGDLTAAAAVLDALQRHQTGFYCLGAGSDLLVADQGYGGVVVRLGEGFREIEGLPDSSLGASSLGATTELTVGGAVPVAHLAAEAAEAGLAGLEFACGIPGVLGGGVATNAGAYGRCFADVLTEVQLATAQGVRWAPAAELEWQYRHCRLGEGVVVTAARLRLESDDSAALLEKHRTILEMRRGVQPQGVWTFGSTFKNPSGGAAGRLLDAAGLKGERQGGAEVSRVHANFIVNLGEASTEDVLTLMHHMRSRVLETSGVSLEPEVRLLGASFPWESTAGGSGRSSHADG